MTVSGSENYTVDYNYNDSEGYKALLQTETKTYESEDNQNTGTVSETTVYTYDKNGNQLSKTTSSKTENFSYDGLNQLIGYTDGTKTMANSEFTLVAIVCFLVKVFAGNFSQFLKDFFEE